MAVIPGTTFERRAQQSTPGRPTGTSTAFMVGIAEWGPVTSVVTDGLRTPDDYLTSYGSGLGTSAVLSDSVETALNEGAPKVFVCRVIGLNPVVSTVTLLDGLGVATLTANGEYVGARGDTLALTVAAGTTSGKQITVTDDGDVVTEADNLDTITEILAAFSSGTVQLVDAGSASADPLPANGTFALAGGTDDSANATDAEWQAALDVLDIDLGPGQVSAPGRTTATAHGQLQTHAALTNRTALLDAPFQANKAQLLTAATAANQVNAERAGLFASWWQIPSSTEGILRYVPPSAVVSGLAGRVPGEDNVQPIGRRGLVSYAIEPVPVFANIDRTELYKAGVNCFLNDASGARLYGFRSVTTKPAWHDLAHNRLFMAIEAIAQAYAEDSVGDRIIGATITSMMGALEGYLQGLYSAGALYGDTADEAFTVIDRNTPALAADRQMLFELYVKASEHAELIRTIGIKLPVA